MKKVSPVLLSAFALLTSTLPAQTPSPDPLADYTVKPHPIDSPLREDLTRQYLLHHAGEDTFLLTAPAAIVIHDTETKDLQQAFDQFDHPRLQGDRPELAGGGEVNVGVHYLIDTDGTIWALLPENIAGRHAIGYNHTALGIEMIALTADRLTMAQLDACTALVAALAGRHPSVKYLFGHFEYMDKTAPHFVLHRELDPAYGPTPKSDPGPVFMEALRARLARHYQVVLEP